jgi:hypothetical protein
VDTLFHEGSGLAVGKTCGTCVGGSMVGGIAVGTGAGVLAGAQAVASKAASMNINNRGLTFIPSLLVYEPLSGTPGTGWMRIGSDS